MHLTQNGLENAGLRVKAKGNEIVTRGLVEQISVQGYLGSFNALFKKITMVEHLCNILINITTAASKQIVKVHGPLVSKSIFFLTGSAEGKHPPK